MISVVCAYNDEVLLNEWLLSSLERQTAEYEVIKVDSASLGFRSAAQALNYGGHRATGKYIMFVHQDVDLVSPSWLEDAEAMLDNISNLGIAGVVGSVEGGATVSERMRNVIVHGDDLSRIGNPITSAERAQTLDELLLVIPRTVFQYHRFDEDTCNDWHLYGTDYCLTMLAAGKGVYVIPLFVIHKSKGASAGKTFLNLPFVLNFGISSEFYKTLKRVLKKHSNNFTWVYTTPGYGKWKTSGSLFFQRLRYSIVEMLRYFIVSR